MASERMHKATAHEIEVRLQEVDFHMLYAHGKFLVKLAQRRHELVDMAQSLGLLVYLPAGIL